MIRKRYTSCGLLALRFRRWSRKGYAAFVSRQRACTMGTLRCHIVERLQQKNGMSVACMPACGCSYETADALAEDTGGVPADVLPAGMAFFVTACYGVAADAAALCAVPSVYDEIFPAGSSGLYPGLPAGRFGGGSFWKRTFEKNSGFFAKVGLLLFLPSGSGCCAGGGVGLSFRGKKRRLSA